MPQSQEGRRRWRRANEMVDASYCRGLVDLDLALIRFRLTSWYRDNPYWTDETLRTAASLALDGMPARWRRICWHCDKGWGHNVGGRKLGHAPSKNGDEKHTPAATRDKPKPRRRPR